MNYAVYAVLSGSSIVHIGICNDVWYLPISVKKHGGTGMLLLSWYLTEQEAIRIQRQFIQALAKVESLRYVDVTYRQMPRYIRRKGRWVAID
jgi:hypothetical protein